jgi:formylglycine-generating enzyme required for sulfatase activity
MKPEFELPPDQTVARVGPFKGKAWRAFAVVSFGMLASCISPLPQPPSSPTGPAPAATATQPPTPPPPVTFRDCPECPEMVVVPAGSFIMGGEPGHARDWELPRRRVRISHPLAVGRFEITQGEWRACIAAGPCKDVLIEDGLSSNPRLPLSGISRFGPRHYIKWLNGKTGRRYRLPSEAEWEYAARAGTTTPWHTGNSLTAEQANIDAKGRRDVGSYPANAFGLHDMHGNVWEWVQDLILTSQTNYANFPRDGRAVYSEEGSYLLARGGSWAESYSSARSAARLIISTPDSDKGMGFRLVRNLTRAERQRFNASAQPGQTPPPQQ